MGSPSLNDYFTQFSRQGSESVSVYVNERKRWSGGVARYQKVGRVVQFSGVTS